MTLKNHDCFEEFSRPGRTKRFFPGQDKRKRNQFGYTVYDS